MDINQLDGAIRTKKVWGFSKDIYTIEIKNEPTNPENKYMVWKFNSGFLSRTVDTVRSKEERGKMLDSAKTATIKGVQGVTNSAARTFVPGFAYVQDLKNRYGGGVLYPIDEFKKDLNEIYGRDIPYSITTVPTNNIELHDSYFTMNGGGRHTVPNTKYITDINKPLTNTEFIEKIKNYYNSKLKD